MDNAVETELKRRLDLWGELKVRGGPDDVEPRLIKQLGIHRGQQGVYRELDVTSAVSGKPAGVAVGLRHTGTSYPDDLSEDGVIYHYPETSRGQRDTLEIVAIKACGVLGLPLFVTITPPDNPRRRNVRLGWVEDYDDEFKRVLITFSEVQGSSVGSVTSEVDLGAFILKISRVYRHSKTKVRPNQRRFQFQVMKRYGAECAVCGLQCQGLLDAAHLCPVEEDGCDDPRNGLVFCLNHHRAFDRGFFFIHPEDLAVQMDPRFQAADIAITRKSIAHLRKLPHREALEWAWLARHNRCVT
jgi:putative restriction endonuclease